MAREAATAQTHRVATGSDVIPGTELLLDTNHESHLKEVKGTGVILIPQPSNNLDDPLNWSPLWKYTVVFVQFAYTFVSVMAALSVAPIFPLLAKEFHLSQTKLNLLSGSCILAQAYANFLIVPYSNIFGRRQASLTLVVLIMLTNVWEALATSYHSLLAARVLNGLTTAISESVMVQVINDVFFSHERAAWTGFYFFTYFVGVFMGAIIAGNIGGRHGWRSFFWLSVALSGFNLITLLFLFPETKYKRSMIGQMGLAAATEEDHSDRETGKGEEKLRYKEQDGPASPNTADLSIVGKGKPSKKQWALWQKPDPRWKSYLVRDTLTPVRAFIYPIIFWASAVTGGSININLFYALTQSEVLSRPPYNFSTSAVGYSNFANMTGGIIGLLTAGPLSDYLARRAARRNGGVREAEMRLTALIPFAILMTVGITIGGVAYQRKWAWPPLLVFGFAGAGLTVTSIPTIVIAYAVDCYKPLAGEIMVVATVVKNTCGFGLSYWLPQLSEKHGLLTPAMVQYSCAMGPLVFGLLVYFYGKRLRVATKNSYVHQLSEY